MIDDTHVPGPTMRCYTSSTIATGYTMTTASTVNINLYNQNPNFYTPPHQQYTITPIGFFCSYGKCSYCDEESFNNLNVIEDVYICRKCFKLIIDAILKPNLNKNVVAALRNILN